MALPTLLPMASPGAPVTRNGFPDVVVLASTAWPLRSPVSGTELPMAPVPGPCSKRVSLTEPVPMPSGAP